MGSVTTSTAATRNVRVLLTGLPADGIVRVVQGPVDMPGPALPEPGTSTSEFAASAWTRGFVDLSIDTHSPRFVRVEVRDATGRVVAMSNPVWLLRDIPDGGIPGPRQVR